jgi:hypothetical protein
VQIKLLEVKCTGQKEPFVFSLFPVEATPLSNAAGWGHKNIDMAAKNIRQPKGELGRGDSISIDLSIFDANENRSCPAELSDR